MQSNKTTLESISKRYAILTNASKIRNFYDK